MTSRGGRRKSRGKRHEYLMLVAICLAANAVLLFGIATYLLSEAWAHLCALSEIQTTVVLGVAVFLLVLVTVGINLWLLLRARAMFGERAEKGTDEEDVTEENSSSCSDVDDAIRERYAEKDDVLIGTQIDGLNEGNGGACDGIGNRSMRRVAMGSLFQ